VPSRSPFVGFSLIAAVSLAAFAPPRNHEGSTEKNVPQNLTEARDLVDIAKAAALNIKNDFQRENVLDHIGAAEAKTGQLDAAVETANAAYPFTMATLAAIGGELGSANDIAKAQIIGAKLKGGQSSTIFAFIAQREAETGNIAQALHTTTFIHDQAVHSEALAWVAQKQAEAGDYVGARKTYAQAKAAYPAQGPDSDAVEVAIAQAQLARGEKLAAHQTIISLKSAEFRSAVLLSAAEELFKEGDQVGSSAWLAEAMNGLPREQGSSIVRYMAIPIQVKLGQLNQAMQSAGGLPTEAHIKGYTAVAVTCAEIGDIPGMNAALEKMLSGADSIGANREFSNHESMLMILNVAAALIDNGKFEDASRLLMLIEQHLDEIAKLTIEPEAQLERVALMAHQGQFDESRSLAMKMRPDAVANVERGTALRTIASLQTKKEGDTSSRRWALTLPDPEDRAYSLLGIAQSLLGIDDVKLPYSAIFVH